MVNAKLLARKPGKIICMKTKGQIVKAWREAREWSPATLGAAVGTSRQNIENLEADSVRNPHYLPRLAKLMGYATVEDLLELRDPPAGPGKLAHAVILDARTVSLTEPKRLEWETSMTIEEVSALPRLFRLPMPDDAMKPKAPMGRWVAFEVTTLAEAGKRVLVRTGDGRMYFRKFKLLEAGGRWAAMPDNDSYPPLFSDVDGLTIVARMLYVETPDED